MKFNNCYDRRLITQSRIHDHSTGWDIPFTSNYAYY